MTPPISADVRLWALSLLCSVFYQRARCLQQQVTDIFCNYTALTKLYSVSLTSMIDEIGPPKAIAAEDHRGGESPS